MHTLSTLLAFLAGVALIALMLQDSFEVMLLPRLVRRRWRWALWAGIGRRMRWSASFPSGLVYWSQERRLPAHYDPGSYVYMSGATLVALGYGDFTPHTGVTQAIAVTEAATGFGLLAVVIGYLPVLYQLFSRRETHVMQLDGRAGSPPTAGALLSRHASNRALHKLDGLLLDWEKWCAELVESHISYPMLSFYRSQHANQNWLAALVMVGVDDIPAFQAKMTFAMSRLAMIELCRVFHLSPISHPEDRIGHQGFEALNSEISGTGLAWPHPADAEGKIAEDATYEPFLQALANYLIIDLPGIAPTGESANRLDNWQRSVRGRSAKSLVEQARRGADPSP